jgi:hypothetical protein
MTPNDWLDMMEADAPALRRITWTFDGPQALARYRCPIRSQPHFVCPLCAWAYMHGAPMYTLAWAFALRNAFNTSDGAAEIADAADGRNGPVRDRLLAILGMEEAL